MFEIKKMILKLKSIELPVLSFLMLSGMNAAGQSFAGYEWETLTCTGEPVARHEAAFIKSGDKFYLMGGRRIQEVSIFNSETNTWTSGTKPTVELHHFEGFSYKGDIYAVGVQTGKYPHETSLTETYIYKPTSDEWVKSFDMPEGRVRASTSTKVYKDKLYMACGIIDGHWEGHVKWFDCYDFKTGKWSKLPSLNTGRHGTQLIWYKKKLYIASGCGQMGGSPELKTIECFSKSKASK